MATKTTSKQTKAPKAKAAATAKPKRTAKAAGKPKVQAEGSSLAAKGVSAAERYLTHRGYEVLELDWKCDAGECDIIARDCNCLVFVEVKTRKNSERGFPSEAMNAKKRERFENIALAYAAEKGEPNTQVRFDVISIVVLGKDKAMIRHHLNAFTR